MSIFKGIIALWHAIKWALRLRKNMEGGCEAFLTQERMLRWRFEFEKISHALETGKMEGLPRIIKWLFANTTLDNHIGKAAGWLFKSKKLETGDDALNQPLYRMH